MFGFVKNLFGKKAKRGYSDLMSSRLISDWLLSGEDVNQRIKPNLATLRSMSRDMLETNHYAISYMNLRVTNVVGPDGFKLQSRVTNRDGSPDKYARTTIEQQWADWKLPENCTIAGCAHHNDEERLQERALGADGETFIQVFPGYDNAHKFAIRTVEADQIDIELTDHTLPNGNRITMGRENDSTGRCVAFWMYGHHPGAHQQSINGNKRSRIPALSEFLKPAIYRDGVEIPNISSAGYILHQYEVKRPGQQRGIPDLAAVITPLRQLERTEDAHSMAARLSSCAVFQQVDSNADVEDPDGYGSAGQDTMDIAPGFIAKNGMGRKWEVLQPAFPNTALPDHGKYTLKGAGQALGVSYPTFSGDLEGTSYSSGRTGALAERDLFKVKQDHAINCRHRPIFQAWLRTQLLYEQLGGLNLKGELRYRNAHIQAHRWDWVDPLKDSLGKKNDLAMRVTTPQRVMIERGLDPEEVVQEWKEWEDMIAAAGLQPDEENRGADTEALRILEKITLSEEDAENQIAPD